MTISVVIVNYRTPTLTARAVGGALDDGADEVIVIDNASRDDSLVRLGRIEEDRLRIVASDSNAGFGTGANHGAIVASGDVLVFLNSDAWPRQGALATMARAVADAGGRMLVGPRLVGDDGSTQRSAGLVPKPDDLLIRGLGMHHIARAFARVPLAGRLVARLRITTEYDQAITATSPLDVTMVSGACLAVGREAFAELGGFDERYFMYFEDADLCRRASRAGWPVRYLPDAVVHHVGGASAPGDYRFGPLHGPSMVVYLRDWHGALGSAVALGLLTVRAVGKTLTIQPGAGRARAALTGGVRAYRRGRTSAPSPASVPSP